MSTKIICSKSTNKPMKFNIFYHLYTTSILLKNDCITIQYYETLFNLN